MQLCVLLVTLPAALVATAALDEAGGSQRDVSAGRLLTSRATMSAQAVAEAWLRSYSSVSQMPDELAELKGANPEAYAIVQALLAKRSLGLLKLRVPSHSLEDTPPAQETQLPAAVPAATSDSTTSVSKPPLKLLHAAEQQESRSVSREESSRSVSWGNPFSFAPGTHVASETGTPAPKWATVQKLYGTLPESQHDVLSSFHWDDAESAVPVSTSLPVSTPQQAPAQQPSVQRDHLSSWLHHHVAVAETAQTQANGASGIESTRAPLLRAQGSAQTALSTVRQSTQQRGYMDMLGPIDDAYPQTPDVDAAGEDSMSAPPPARAATTHERFPLESFSWDDTAEPAQKHAFSSLSAQSQLHHAASPSKKTVPHPAAVEKSAETHKVRLQSRKQPGTSSSGDDANPYLKGLDLGGPAAVRPSLPKENPYLAALS
mmetsp:Transcript_110391/g.206879  ORF Transcript_110391/g.206879 Transcript_110391/m.206879 type:complete len:431 (-) Transcript_110391:88-1380(-)